MNIDPNPTSVSKFFTLNELWAANLEEHLTNGIDCKSYFITMTFDRYRDRYMVNPGDQATNPTRDDVIAGLTRTMPKFEAGRERLADVHRWYLRLLKNLLGGQYGRHYNRQPKAIGYFDEPAFKSHRSGTIPFLRPGDKFPHLHMVMIVDGLPCVPRPEEVAWQAFERLYETGELQKLWRRGNPEGEVHVKPCFDITGALDYAAKTAKRKEHYDEYEILLPLERSDAANGYAAEAAELS